MKILSLDGGGAKGFYTLGVLREVEAAAGCKLCQKFDLIYGTSTGSIIAALLALGCSVEEVHQHYAENVLRVVGAFTASRKSAALAQLGDDIFGDRRFDAFQTGIGIVSTRWLDERPLIFKNDVSRAAGRKGTFTPGFGCTISDAVQASCSAYPLFDRKCVSLDNEVQRRIVSAVTTVDKFDASHGS